MAIKTVNSGSDEPYKFAPDFERALAYLACSDERTWTMAAHALEPALLESDEARLLITAAQAIARDLGKPPCSTLLVIQRLRRWVSDGKQTLESVYKANDYLDAALEAGVPNVEATIGELVPILRRRLEFAAIETGLKAYQGGASLAPMDTALEKARGLGRISSDMGTTWGAQTAARIVADRSIERLATYIPELDDMFTGGFGRGTMTALLGGSGAGKSIGLTHLTVASMMQGLNVAVATLEVPTSHWAARVHACAVGVETNEVMGALTAQELTQQTNDMRDRAYDHYGYPMGSVVIRDFPAKVTSPRDITTWVEKLERGGARYDVIVIDYCDKLRVSQGKKSVEVAGSSGTYGMMGDIYDELFNYTKDTRRWLFTATQAKSHNDAMKRILDENDCADSINKTRVLDQLISLNPRDDYTSILWYIAKARYNGCRGVKIGPLPVAFGVARIAPVLWVP